jgi:hypothetical protein
VDASSGGGVQVTVNKELSVEASSGGYVNYKDQGIIKNIKNQQWWKCFQERIISFTT